MRDRVAIARVSSAPTRDPLPISARLCGFHLVNRERNLLAQIGWQAGPRHIHSAERLAHIAHRNSWLPLPELHGGSPVPRCHERERYGPSASDREAHWLEPERHAGPARVPSCTERDAAPDAHVTNPGERLLGATAEERLVTPRDAAT